MKNKFSSLVTITCALGSWMPALAESERTGRVSRGATSHTVSHQIRCENDEYRIKYYESKGADAVVLEEFSVPDKLGSGNLFLQLSEGLAQFRSISNMRFACGYGDVYGSFDEITAANFFVIEVEGRHVKSSHDAREACIERGWNFEFDTKRSFTVEDGAMNVAGDEIGYCFGETEYFTVPLSVSDGEGGL